MFGSVVEVLSRI